MTKEKKNTLKILAAYTDSEEIACYACKTCGSCPLNVSNSECIDLLEGLGISNYNSQNNYYKCTVIVLKNII